MTGDSSEQPHIDRNHQLSAHGSQVDRHKVVWVVIWVLLVLVALVVVLVWRHVVAAKKVPPAPPKISTTTATAKQGDIGVYLDAIGTVTPVYTASITSQVNGLVLAVHFKEGQQVSKGDPLIDIDSRTYRATLLQAQGLLERDENLLAQAQMDLERYRAALARNAIAKQIVDDEEKLVLQDQGTASRPNGFPTGRR